MNNSENFLPNSGYYIPNPYLGSDDSNSNSQYKITRLTADRVEPDFDPRYNFDDLQGDDVQGDNLQSNNFQGDEDEEEDEKYEDQGEEEEEDEKYEDQEEEEEEDEEYEDQGEYEEQGEEEDQGEEGREREEEEEEYEYEAEEEEYELGEGEDVCSCGNICLFEDALCVDCIEQNKYYTLVPRSGWTDVEYTDEGKDIIKNFPRYKERSSVDILYYLSQDFCEFYYLYKNNSQAAAHQIQVVLGRAFTGN